MRIRSIPGIFVVRAGADQSLFYLALSVRVGKVSI